MRIAAIISGELRFKDQKHFKAFSHAMSSFTPRYIVTYLAYETLALQLSCNVLITEPLGLEKGSASHLYQWHLLQLAMRAFAFRADDTDAILRVRTDTTLPSKLPSPIVPGRLYAFTDWAFLAERVTFVTLFADYLDVILSKYMGSAFNEQDYDALLTMPLPGTTENGGCVHPCERSPGRKCPAGLDLRRHVPWHYAPPGKCPTYAFRGTNNYKRTFCSEPSLGHRVYALNYTCERLGHMQMLKHWDVQKPLDWGKAPVVSQHSTRGANHTIQSIQYRCL